MLVIELMSFGIKVLEFILNMSTIKPAAPADALGGGT
jgi:hypothetical protein